MKKTIRVLLPVLALLLLPVLLTACGHTHTYSEEWSCDGSHHWHEGSCEHEKAEEAAPIKDFTTHTMGEPVTVAPTCGKAGSVTVACTVCGYKKVTALPATGAHTYEQNKTVYKTEGELIYERRECDTCGTLTGNLASYNAKWSSDATNHWHAPKDADGNHANIDVAEHTWSEPTVVPANCGVDGTSTRRCTVCKYTEVTPLAASGEHDYTKQNFGYRVMDGVLYHEKTCDVCNLPERTVVPNSVVVTNTAEAQAALDAATEGAVIYLTKASYGTLYLRTSDTESDRYTTPDWAGGGGTLLYREISGLTVIGASGAKVDAIVVEAQTYTPGGNKHSNSTIDHMKAAIKLKNVTLKGIAFTGTANALNLSGNLAIDGLTLDGCSFTDATKKNSFLVYSGKVNEVKVGDTPIMTTALANITVKNCTVNGADRAIELRGTENLTIEDNSFRNIAGRTILLSFDGTPYTGTVTVKDNTANTLGERFLRATNITGDITVTGNTLSGCNGADADVIKITDATGAVNVADNTIPDGKTVTVPAAAE